MTFVDTNVFMYCVGRAHPLKESAREFFTVAIGQQEPLCTSAEVLQELAYCYLTVSRRETLDAALSLIVRAKFEVWPLESEDVHLAFRLYEQFPSLSARDLCHLASCQRRNVNRIKTFDKGLATAVNFVR